MDDNGKFIKVYDSFLGIGLKSIDILILSKVAEFNRNNLQCYLTNEQLSNMFGESSKTIQRAITKLVDMNVLDKDTRFVEGNGRGNRQRVLTAKPKSLWNTPSKQLNGDDGKDILSLPSLNGRDILSLPNDGKDILSLPSLNGRDKSEQWKGQNVPIKDNLKENLLLKEKGDADAHPEEERRENRTDVRERRADALECADAHAQGKDEIMDADTYASWEDVPSDILANIKRDFQSEDRYRKRYMTIKEKYRLDFPLDKTIPEKVDRELAKRSERDRSLAAESVGKNVMSRLGDDLSLRDELCRKIGCDEKELSLIAESVAYGKPDMTVSDFEWFVDRYVVEDGLTPEYYDRDLKSLYEDYPAFLSALSSTRGNWRSEETFTL